MTTAWSLTRVIKKISPQQPGARKLARRYGDALVCVRHRHDAEGAVRYTTVELLVEQLPIAHRTPPDQLVAVRLASGEASLRRLVIASGGQWDPTLRAWWMTRATARRLRQLKKIVALGPV